MTMVSKFGILENRESLKFVFYRIQHKYIESIQSSTQIRKNMLI